MLLGAGPGDIFVVRNVANLVPPYRTERRCPASARTSSSRSRGLNVENIIILGHSGCGGIRALMDGEGITRAAVRVHRHVGHHCHGRRASGSCASWPAARMRCRRGHASTSAIALSLENLMSFPWIRERVERGQPDAARLVLRHRRGRFAGILAGDARALRRWCRVALPTRHNAG